MVCSELTTLSTNRIVKEYKLAWDMGSALCQCMEVISELSMPNARSTLLLRGHLQNSVCGVGREKVWEDESKPQC